MTPSSKIGMGFFATAIEGIAVAFDSLRANKVRSGLTILGVTIGVLVVMVMAAVIHEKGAPEVFRWKEVEVGARGSLFLTRPAIMHYMAKRADFDAAATDLFEVVGRGAVKVSANHVFPLREVAEAHTAIEQRRTTGSVVLLPDA